MTKPLAILALIAAILAALLAIAAHGVMPGLLGVIATADSGPITSIYVAGSGGVWDPEGPYPQNGTHNEKPAYELETGGWWTWWDGEFWIIALEKDSFEGGYYVKTGDPVTGEYTGYGDAEGFTATVSAP